MGEMNFKNRGELVYETLKQEILDLRLKPGQMISENDICERFGVSRTPVRDALRLLQGGRPVIQINHGLTIFAAPAMVSAMTYILVTSPTFKLSVSP